MVTHRFILSDDTAVHIPARKMAAFQADCEHARDEGAVEAIIHSFASELADQAADLATAPPRRGRLLHEIVQTLKGVRPVPPHVSQARLAVCRGCEHGQVLLGGTEHPQREPMLRCAQCGCLMNAKARMTLGGCPIGKFE